MNGRNKALLCVDGRILVANSMFAQCSRRIPLESGGIGDFRSGIAPFLPPVVGAASNSPPVSGRLIRWPRLGKAAERRRLPLGQMKDLLPSASSSGAESCYSGPQVSWDRHSRSVGRSWRHLER